MARLSSGEGLNLGVRPPATFMGLPVRGFFPLRALRRPTENVPNPTSVTGWPRLREVRIDRRSARSARSEAALVQPLSAAIEVTRPARVMREAMPSPYAAPKLAEPPWPVKRGSLTRGCAVA